MEHVNSLRKKRGLGSVSFSIAVKFLCARKFDIDRVVALYEQHEETRYREALTSFDPNVDSLKSELSTSKFTIPVRFFRMIRPAYLCRVTFIIIPTSCFTANPR